MKEYIKIAWRNIWRNKRRTIITIASVFFAMFFALIMRSMQVGSYSHWTDGIVKAFSGFIQIHKNGYWDDKIVDNAFEYNEDLIEKLKPLKNINGIVPRFESGALAANENKSKVVLITGIDPQKEQILSDPEKNLIEGKYLDDETDGVLVSSRLADFLKLRVNDTLVLISQGYHGASAAGLFPIYGIVKLPNPELDRRLVFMNLQSCQNFYDAPGMLTSLNINLYDTDNFLKTTKQIANIIDTEKYEVMDWKEINPEIVQLISSDQSSGYIMLGILYLIIGFGVLGTVLMMTMERKREFGVMIAVGMKKMKLGFILLTEMIMLGFIGIVAGVITSVPVIMYYHNHPLRLGDDYIEMFESYGMEPVMPFGFESGFFIWQSLIVLLIFFLAIVYPLYSVVRINLIKALRA